MNNRYIYGVFIGIILFIAGCSPRVNTFYNRWSQPIFTRFNVMFNGEQALQKGKAELDVRYQENFFQILPVEAVSVSDKIKLKGQENTLFERAEQKATKAIQRHSMVVNGVQKNHRIDDAYLLLGMARYYNQKYVAALEAFTYIIYNYPQSDRLAEVAIWREKTNLRLGKDEMAMQNLIKLIDSLSMTKEIESEARATLAQSLINLKRYPLAVNQLEKAATLTKEKTLKGRYLFISAQLNELLRLPDKAVKNYRSVLALNWNIPRILWVEALLGESRTASFSAEEREKFAKYLSRVTSRYEHRYFQDILYYAQAELFKNESPKRAIDFYEKSISKNTQRPTLKMTTHKTVAEIYFNEKRYLLAYNHYNQAYLLSEKNTLEQLYLKRKRDNLNAVAELERKIQNSEQMLSLKSKTDQQRMAFYDEHLKSSAITSSGTPPADKPAVNTDSERFYFYNPTTVIRGIDAFRKKWGVFDLQDDWRFAHKRQSLEAPLSESATSIEKKPQENVANAWLKSFPQTPQQWEALVQEKNQMLYKLAEIYSTQFGDDQLAVEKWRSLYADNPQQPLKKKTYYQLHKAYERLYNANKTSDAEKASHYAAVLSTDFPLNDEVVQYEKQHKNTEQKQKRIEHTFDMVEMYAEKGDYRSIDRILDTLHFDSPFQNRVPYLLILKAKTHGRLDGIAFYQKELQGLKKLYKNSEYVPSIDSMLIGLNVLMKDDHFVASGHSWKIIVRGVKPENVPDFEKALKKQFDENQKTKQCEVSQDIFNRDQDWIVIHNISDKALVLSLLKKWRKEYPDYQWIPISYGNYARVQRFKNIDQYQQYLKDNSIDF